MSGACRTIRVKVKTHLGAKLLILLMNKWVDSDGTKAYSKGAKR